MELFAITIQVHGKERQRNKLPPVSIYSTRNSIIDNR